MDNKKDFFAVVKKTEHGFLTKDEIEDLLTILDSAEFIPISFGNEYMGVIAPQRLRNHKNIEDIESIIEDVRDFTFYVDSPKMSMILKFGDGEITDDGRGIIYPYGRDTNYCILYHDTLENLAKLEG